LDPSLETIFEKPEKLANRSGILSNEAYKAIDEACFGNFFPTTAI
jgi:hypothetical protein